LRGQGTYLSDDEITRIIDAVSTTEPQYVKELVQLKASEPEPEGHTVPDRDDLYDSAVELVIREGRGSCSLLQRALGIGYGRAARLIDFMAEDGVVGPYNGSQAREVVVSLEQWERMRGHAGSEPAAAAPAPSPRRSGNRILLSSPAPRNDDGFDQQPDDDRIAPAVAAQTGGPGNDDMPETAAARTSKKNQFSRQAIPTPADDDEDALDENSPPWKAESA
jgi:S-DNA-T family DNA segregation ATPase FtsK/SpoIIIE